jgi:hypothetical protein
MMARCASPFFVRHRPSLRTEHDKFVVFAPAKNSRIQLEKLPTLCLAAAAHKKTSPSQWAHLHYQQDNQAVIGGRNGRNRRKKELNKSNATGVEADLRIGA